jgi:hypothetical protein
MHKDELTVVLVVIGIGLLILLVLGAIGLGVGGFGVRHSSGGCNYIPLVNGQPAYACSNTPPP